MREQAVGAARLAGATTTEAAGMLRRFSMVVTEHPAEALTATHAPDGLGGVGQGRDDRVAESLVISLGVVMREVLVHRSSQRVLAEEDHPVEALRLD